MKKTKIFWYCILLIFFTIDLILGWYIASCYLPRRAPSDSHLVCADKIIVEKSARKMYLFEKENVVGTYDISLGFNPAGHKKQQGDGKTPEGRYTISSKNSKSKYHLSLAISYPSSEDILNARKKQVNPGGDIVIHGYPNHYPEWLANIVLKNKDWTNGCIGVTNDEIEQIWSYVKEGTIIEIRP